MQKVLITGASGLIGKRLIQLLLKKGYPVHALSRSADTTHKSYKTFSWNIDKGEVDTRAFEGIDAIIHLAGAGVAESRWTDTYKKEIIDSRVKGANLIFDILKKDNHGVRTFISAAAVGYYGDCGDELLGEEHPAGKGFLSEVCKKWEQSAKQFSKIGIREVRCRIGIVLARNGGALPELTKTLGLGVSAYFAKFPLYYPWVHVDDVCGAMIQALKNENMKGAYNTTAPTPLPIKELMQEIIRVKKVKALLVPAPSFAIQLAMGEMSEMLLSSQRCSAEKLMESGYLFKYGNITEALESIYD